jgi:hypothetical protein
MSDGGTFRAPGVSISEIVARRGDRPWLERG